MDLGLDQYLHNSCGYQSLMNGHKLNAYMESNDIDVDLFEDGEREPECDSQEAKILENNGRISIDTSDTPGIETVEINAHTVNPNDTKTGAEDFKILKTIGKGGYGTVFLVQKVTQPKLNEYFAMKVLKKAKIVRSEKDTAHTVSERNILQMLRHPFLVKLNYAFQSQSYLYIVLEYCPGGELFNYLEKIVYLKEDAASFYVAEIALAIGHLHSLGIIYRDLKSENILLDKDGHVKLTDFGLSKEGVPTTNTFCGTIEYMAPEIIKCLGHGKEVDWWSLGTLLFDMLSGGPPFYQDRGKADTAQNILHADVKFPDSFSAEVIALIRGLLTRDPKRRLGSHGDVEEIKQHEFFKKNKINWQDVYDRKMTPPFKPILASATDVSMFDQNFTSMKPTVSPVDNKTAVPQNLFQGFSYVANSVCDSSIRAADEYSISLRNDRRKLLLNTKLNGNVASCSPRLARIAQEPSESRHSEALMDFKSSQEHSNGLACFSTDGRSSVEPATDCLEMEIDIPGPARPKFHFDAARPPFRRLSESTDDVDDCPGAQQIPSKGLASRHSGIFKAPVVMTTPPRSTPSVQVAEAPQPQPTAAPRKPSLIQVGSQKGAGSGNNNNCLLM